MIVAVYDVEGKLVKILANQIFEEGMQQVPWNGCNESGEAMPSGVYMVRLNGQSVRQVKKVVLVR